MKNQYRLKKNNDFRKVYGFGKSVADRYIVMYVKPNKEENNRFGFSISKKIGIAVVRNRVRRKLREIVRLKGNNKIKGNYDIVIIARKNIIEAKYEDLEKSFLRLGKKIGIL